MVLRVRFTDDERQDKSFYFSLGLNSRAEKKIKAKKINQICFELMERILGRRLVFEKIKRKIYFYNTRADST